MKYSKIVAQVAMNFVSAGYYFAQFPKKKPNSILCQNVDVQVQNFPSNFILAMRRPCLQA